MVELLLKCPNKCVLTEISVPEQEIFCRICEVFVCEQICEVFVYDIFWLDDAVIFVKDVSGFTFTREGRFHGLPKCFSVRDTSRI